MEAKIIIPLVAALLGTLIGGLTTLLGLWIQQRSQSKRDKIKLACEMAKEEHSMMITQLKEDKKKGTVQPLSVFQSFHFDVLTELEKGPLTKEGLAKIHQRNSSLY